jgi:hypothetical protein
VLSDYPLSRPVRLVEASALAPEATPKAVATDQRIEQAIAQLEKVGDVTLKAIAKLAQVSLGRVAKSEAWKSCQKRVSVWSVDFPNAIKNIATWKNYKPPANVEPEPTTVIVPETVPVAVELIAIAPTSQAKQQEPIPPPVLVSCWKFGRMFQFTLQRFIDGTTAEIKSVLTGELFTVPISQLAPWGGAT